MAKLLGNCKAKVLCNTNGKNAGMFSQIFSKYVHQSPFIHLDTFPENTISCRIFPETSFYLKCSGLFEININGKHKTKDRKSFSYKQYTSSVRMTRVKLHTVDEIIFETKMAFSALVPTG